MTTSSKETVAAVPVPVKKPRAARKVKAVRPKVDPVENGATVKAEVSDEAFLEAFRAYLQEVFGMDQDATSMAFALFEYAGIPGTILCGWISSRFFQGRCAPVNVIFMLIVAVGIVLYWEAAALAALTGIELQYIVYVALALIGGAVYGPIAMIGVQALSLVPKNAAGTAAGFMGLFGYMLGDAVLSKVVMGYVADSSLGWNFTFEMFVTASIAAVVICIIAWGKEKRTMEERLRQAREEHKLA